MDSVRSEESGVNILPIEDLQVRAAEQRRQMHETATELKGKIAVTRERLDIRNTARQNFWSVAAIVTAAGLLFGYASAGAFRRG